MPWLQICMDLLPVRRLLATHCMPEFVSTGGGTIRCTKLWVLRVHFWTGQIPVNPCVSWGQPVRIPLTPLFRNTWGVAIACGYLALLWLEKEKVEDKCVVNCRPKHREWSCRAPSGEERRAAKEVPSWCPPAASRSSPKGGRQESWNCWKGPFPARLDQAPLWEPALSRELRGERASRAWPKQISAPALGQLGLQGGWSLEMLALHKNTLNQTQHRESARL